MVAVWPPRWRSEQRVSGLAPDFSPLRRCQSTLNINVGSLPPPRTTPPIAKISSMVAGQMRHIGCCVTALFATGRPRVGRLRADDRAKARSLRGHQAAAEADRYRSYTPGPDTVGEIEPLSLWSGQGVALVRKVQPAAEIVREMNDDAKVILRRLAQQCSSQ